MHKIFLGILKTLSGSRHPVECGKLHLMLSKFVPIYEKSGLNLGGEYSADVIDADAEVIDYELPEELAEVTERIEM